MKNLTDEIAHLSRLLRVGLGMRGATLGDQLRRGGRLLPKQIRAAAQRLAAAETVIGAPKLAKQLDIQGLAKDYRDCVLYLERVSQGRYQPLWWRIASWVALAIVIVAAFAAMIFYPN